MGHFDFKALTIKKRQRSVVHGQVVATIGVGEFFRTVKQKYFFHHQPPGVKPSALLSDMGG
jgi:hypothetical protein